MIRSAILCVFVAFLAACASVPAGSDSPPTPTSANLVNEYRIGVDDVVQVNVWRNEDLSATVPVRPDGKISVPLVGDVNVAGRTPAEVSQDISERLKVYVKDPQVAVIVAELNSHEFLSRVRVTGAVRTPVTMPFRPGMTVLDAVLAAGGINEFAAPEKSRLFRKQADEVTAYSVKLESILTRGDLGTNFDLAPGDVITVPERSF